MTSDSTPQYRVDQEVLTFFEPIQSQIFAFADARHVGVQLGVIQWLRDCADFVVDTLENTPATPEEIALAQSYWVSDVPA